MTMEMERIVASRTNSYGLLHHHLKDFAVGFPFRIHLGVTVNIHGCAHLSVPHHLLLHTNGCSDGVKERTIPVANRVSPRQSFDREPLTTSSGPQMPFIRKREVNQRAWFIEIKPIEADSSSDLFSSQLLFPVSGTR